MTIDDVETALAEAYTKQKESGSLQGIVLPWELIQLLMNVYKRADESFNGSGKVTPELADAINDLENYDSENEECTIH